MKRLIFVFISICIFTYSTYAQNFGSAALRKLQYAEFAITNFYVDEVDEDKLVEEAIIQMLTQLDPHSTYSDAEEVRKLNEPLQGNFEGIGVQFNMVEDTLFVVQTVSGGPSEKVGILAGDRIVSVNDTTIAGVKISTEEIMRRLRGPKGTTVNVKILRRGADSLLPFAIQRDKIPIYSLDASYMINSEIGYIKINRFGATTTQELTNAMKDLQKKGMKNLILDLQGNGGGYLQAAVEMANEFLQQKDLIVYTEGKRSPRSDFFAQGNGSFQNSKLIVLIDEYSASASEIVAGAIQDWDRGIIVGRRSFGKGLVQRPINLPDSSMIRLTVARYYTPAGRSIQKPYENVEEYNKDLVERYNKGEMMSADSIHFPDSLKFTTKRLGRTVYGGGGIMPDYFVPVDTTLFTNYHRQLRNKSVIMETERRVMENNRSDWQKRYPDFERFNRNFIVDDTIMNQIIDAGTNAGVEFNQEEYNKSKPLLQIQLKALIARDLFGIGEYFQVINEVNESLNLAIDLMGSDESFDDLLRKKN